MARFVGDPFNLNSGETRTLYTCPEGSSAVLGGVRVVNAGKLTSKAPETPGAETTAGDTAFSVGVVRPGAGEGGADETYWLAGSNDAGEPTALGERPPVIGAGHMLRAGDSIVALAFGAGLVAHISVTEASS